MSAANRVSSEACQSQPCVQQTAARAAAGVLEESWSSTSPQQEGAQANTSVQRTLVRVQERACWSRDPLVQHTVSEAEHTSARGLVLEERARLEHTL